VGHNPSSLSLVRNNTTGGTQFPPHLVLASSGGTAVGSNTLSIVDGQVGTISFQGADGTEFVEAAQIRAEIDGTPGANDMPGRLVFSTTADGAASPTERLRITSAGRVGIGNTTPRTTLVVGTEGGYPAGSASDSCRLVVQSADLISKNGLRVVANNYLGASEAYLDLVNFGSKNYTYESGFRLTGGVAAGGNTSNAYLAFSTTALPTDATESSTVTLSEKMRIDSSGRVGIGTSSPGSALHVNGGDIILQTEDPGNRFIRTSFAGGAIQIRGSAGTEDRGLRFGIVDNNIVFNETARIQSNRLLVGTSSASGASRFVVQGNVSGGNFASMAIAYNSGGAISPDVTLGEIKFTDQEAANTFAGITAATDGTAGTDDYPGRLVFSTTADGASTPTERMRIGSDGNVYFNTTSNPNPDNEIGLLNIVSDGAASRDAINIKHTINGNNSINIWQTGATTFNAIHFYKGDVQTAVGAIVCTTTATTYTTASDYRIKENVVPLINAIDRLNDLQVYRFNFVADPNLTVDGFIAHEAQAVVPECVTGQKDAVDDEENPVYQGIDQSKLVPLLTAALQEAIAKIEDLEGRLTAAGL
jgi:hypothetical protein